MHRNVPEEIVLKFWPLLLEFADSSSLLNQRSKGRTYGHIYAALNYCSALKLYIEGATLQCNMRAIDLLNEVSDKGNTVFLSAAIHNSNEALILCLGHLITEGNLEDKTTVMHRKNLRGQSLLQIILKQKGDMLVPRQMILAIEGEIHKTFQSVSKCFRDNLNLQTSAEVHNTLQFMKQYVPKDRSARIMNQLQIFAECFLGPFIVMVLDIVTDLLVVIGYGYKVFDQTNASKEEEIYLPYKTRFIYSATFLAVPWLFYLIEFLRSPLRHSKRAKTFTGFRAVLWLYLLVRNILLFIFWPIDQLIVKVP